MKLIKLSSDHYIIVDDSEIKEDCYALCESPLGEREIVMANGQCKLDRRITHSTQPLEEVPLHKMPNGELVNEIWYDKIKQLSLSEVKELLGEVDVEKKAFRHTNLLTDYLSPKEFNCMKEGYVSGYNQALEDNKDRRFTEEDIRKAMDLYKNTSIPLNDVIQSLQPPTSWDVEFVNGKLKLL